MKAKNSISLLLSFILVSGFLGSCKPPEETTTENDNVDTVAQTQVDCTQTSDSLAQAYRNFSQAQINFVNSLDSALSDRELRPTTNSVNFSECLTQLQNRIQEFRNNNLNNLDTNTRREVTTILDGLENNLDEINRNIITPLSSGITPDGIEQVNNNLKVNIADKNKKTFGTQVLGEIKLFLLNKNTATQFYTMRLISQELQEEQSSNSNNFVSWLPWLIIGVFLLYFLIKTSDISSRHKKLLSNHKALASRVRDMQDQQSSPNTAFSPSPLQIDEQTYQTLLSRLYNDIIQDNNLRQQLSQPTNIRADVASRSSFFSLPTWLKKVFIANESEEETVQHPDDNQIETPESRIIESQYPNTVAQNYESDDQLYEQLRQTLYNQLYSHLSQQFNEQIDLKFSSLPSSSRNNNQFSNLEDNYLTSRITQIEQRLASVQNSGQLSNSEYNNLVRQLLSDLFQPLYNALFQPLNEQLNQTTDSRNRQETPIQTSREDRMGNRRNRQDSANIQSTQSVVNTPSGASTPAVSTFPTPQWVGTYNSNPRSFLRTRNAIEVSETEESMGDRRLGSDQAAILERKNRGNYCIIEEATYKYLVPSRNLRINQHNYKTVEALFECRNYNPNASEDFRLVQPAIVTAITNGQTWQLQQAGILEF